MTSAGVLLPFDTNLPAADEAMDALYDAFAAYSTTKDPVCRQCYDDDYIRAVLQISDPRHASFHAIKPLYRNYPGCSGPDRAMAFLPRAVELGFWDDDIEIDHRIAQTNVWAWPDDQQAALRTVLSIAVVSWFRDGKPAPLTGPPLCPFCGTTCDERIIVGEDMIRVLFLLRIDPFSFFPWLVGVGTPRAAMTLAETIPNGACLEEGSFFWGLLGDQGNDMIDGAKALNERIIMAACDAISVDTLSALLSEFGESRKELSEMISQTLAMDADYRVAKDEAALAKGLKRIAAGIAAAKS